MEIINTRLEPLLLKLKNSFKNSNDIFILTSHISAIGLEYLIPELELKKNVIIIVNEEDLYSYELERILKSKIKSYRKYNDLDSYDYLRELYLNGAFKIYFRKKKMGFKKLKSNYILFKNKNGCEIFSGDVTITTDGLISNRSLIFWSDSIELYNSILLECSFEGIVLKNKKSEFNPGWYSSTIYDIGLVLNDKNKYVIEILYKVYIESEDDYVVLLETLSTKLNEDCNFYNIKFQKSLLLELEKLINLDDSNFSIFELELKLKEIVGMTILLDIDILLGDIKIINKKKLE